MSDNKRGRPVTDEPRASVRKVRLTETEAFLIDEAAHRDKVPVARWIRERAIEAARKGESRG